MFSIQSDDSSLPFAAHHVAHFVSRLIEASKAEDIQRFCKTQGELLRRAFLKVAKNGEFTIGSPRGSEEARLDINVILPGKKRKEILDATPKEDEGSQNNDNRTMKG